MANLKLKVIVGSTRPNRFSEKPAAWIFEEAKKLEGVDTELLDLRDYPMPFFDEAMTPSMKKEPYAHETVKRWTAKIAEADGFVIVSPEYNHSVPAVLKNAMDYVYQEWNDKAVGFVSWGSVGGARAVEHLRAIAIELHMAPVRAAVHIPGAIPFGQAPWDPLNDEHLMRAAKTMLEQLVRWAKAMKTTRT